MRRWMPRFFAVGWAATITLIGQFWIGSATIYRADLAERVVAAHLQLLNNAPPPGGDWGSSGLNGVNVRVGAIAVAEIIHRATNLTVPHAYFVLDTVMLFASLLLLLHYLSRCVTPALAVLGVTALGALLPLTYQLFWYHPWDRLSLFGWILVLCVLRERQWWAAAVLLPLAVAVKYDIMLLPGALVFVEFFDRRRLTFVGVARAAGLLTISMGTYATLRVLRPGGFRQQGPEAVLQQVQANINDIVAMNLHWPPLLGFSLPIALAAVGFSRSDAWAKGCAVFGLLLFVPFALQSNLAEFRAHMPVLILLAPAALRGVATLLDTDDLALANAR